MLGKKVLRDLGGKVFYGAEINFLDARPRSRKQIFDELLMVLEGRGTGSG